MDDQPGFPQSLPVVLLPYLVPVWLHEVANPLTALRLHAEDALLDLPAGHPVRESVLAISKDLDRISAFSTVLQDFLRPPSQTVGARAADVLRMAQTLASPFLRRQRILLECLPHANPMLEGSCHQTAMLLVAALVLAGAEAPGGGAVRVHFESNCSQTCRLEAEFIPSLAAGPLPASPDSAPASLDRPGPFRLSPETLVLLKQHADALGIETLAPSLAGEGGPFWSIVLSVAPMS